MCLCTCVGVPYEAEGGVRSPRARVTGSCDHPNVGSENQILVLYTSRKKPLVSPGAISPASKFPFYFGKSELVSYLLVSLNCV